MTVNFLHGSTGFRIKKVPQITDVTTWLATCPKGMEQLLADELGVIGASEIKQTVAAVHFQGSLELAYKACLWSRLANRILLPLLSFKLDSANDLYTQSIEIPWEEHLTENNSIAIDFIGTSKHIDNSMYGAQLLKDAIVDRIRRVAGGRPNVDAKSPDIRIQARQHKGQVVYIIPKT